MILVAIPALGHNVYAEQSLADVPAIKDPVPLPNRDIRYQENGVAPDWKQGWDKARDLFRQQKFGKAFIQYELLLAQKENIDEARWEYSIIAIHLKRWDQAAEQLDILITHDPNNKKYLFARADLYLTVSDFQAANKLFIDLLSSSQNNEEKIHALEGLIDINEHAGSTDHSILELQETLLSLKPQDGILRQNTVKTALSLNLPQKALALLGDSPVTNPIKPEELKLRAAIADQMGHQDKALEYRLQHISIVADNIEVLLWLENYYFNIGAYPQALVYLETLLKLEPGNTNALLRGAELNLLMGRTDKSLEFYNKYLIIVPSDSMVMEKKRHALQSMAVDLLALVENDGSRLLWRDLVKVTDDRLAIYKIMTDLLRARDKKDELIKILTIIHEDDPGDKGVSEELAQLLPGQEKAEEANQLSPPEIDTDNQGNKDDNLPTPPSTNNLKVKSEITP